MSNEIFIAQQPERFQLAQEIVVGLMKDRFPIKEWLNTTGDQPEYVVTMRQNAFNSTVLLHIFHAVRKAARPVWDAIVAKAYKDELEDIGICEVGTSDIQRATIRLVKTTVLSMLSERKAELGL